MARKTRKKKTCSKCRYTQPASKFRSGCSVCDHCERMMRDLVAQGRDYNGVIPRLTPAEKRIYSKP